MTLTAEQHRRRIRNGWKIVAQDGTATEFAKLEGVSKAAIHFWLVRHHLHDLREALKGGKRRCDLSREQTWSRAERLAECIATGKPFRTVAKAEGVSDAAISVWKRRNWLLIEEALYERRAA